MMLSCYPWPLRQPLLFLIESTNILALQQLTTTAASCQYVAAGGPTSLVLNHICNVWSTRYILVANSLLKRVIYNDELNGLILYRNSKAGLPMDNIHENLAYSYSYPQLFKSIDIFADIILVEIIYTKEFLNNT